MADESFILKARSRSCEIHAKSQSQVYLPCWKQKAHLPLKIQLQVLYEVRDLATLMCLVKQVVKSRDTTCMYSWLSKKCHRNIVETFEPSTANFNARQKAKGERQKSSPVRGAKGKQLISPVYRSWTLQGCGESFKSHEFWRLMQQ